jgi:rhamnosyltransferase subunit B
MDYIILTVGSDGDVFPMVSLGRGLKARGHRVILVAAPVYSDAASQSGVDFVSLSTSESCGDSLRDKPLLATRYAALFHERYSVPWNAIAYEVIRERASDDLVVISVNRPNMWADLLARAHFSVPVIRVQLDLPYLGSPKGHVELLLGTDVQRRLAVRVESAWRNAMAASGIPGRKLSLERLTRSVGCTATAIALWPQWVLGEDIDQYMFPTFGFIPQPENAVAPDVSMNGLSGQKLVVFVAGTSGTTRMWAQRFFDTSARICAHLGCVGVFLGGVAADGCTAASDWIIRRPFLPLSAVLGRASAIVHHGGIGTAAAAIRHGVPQVVIPRVFGQAGNAEWLRRLGVCAVLDPKGYTAAQGAAVLREVLTDSRYRRASQQYALRCDPEADLRRVCEYLDAPDLLQRLRSVAPREAAQRAWYRRASGHLRRSSAGVGLSVFRQQAAPAEGHPPDK